MIMIRKRARVAKVLKVIILDSDDYMRKKLKEYYDNSVWPCFIGKYDNDQIFNSADTAQVRKKVDNGLDLDMVICSEGFSLRELDELREWLCLRNSEAVCIQVRLISGAKLCVGLV
jgi:hypothetical protein